MFSSIKFQIVIISDHFPQKYVWNSVSTNCSTKYDKKSQLPGILSKDISYLKLRHPTKKKKKRLKGTNEKQNREKYLKNFKRTN